MKHLAPVLLVAAAVLVCGCGASRPTQATIYDKVGDMIDAQLGRTYSMWVYFSCNALFFPLVAVFLRIGASALLEAWGFLLFI